MSRFRRSRHPGGIARAAGEERNRRLHASGAAAPKASALPSGEIPESGQCPCHNVDLPLLGEVTADPAERYTLTLIRLIMAGYCADRMVWLEAALTESIAGFGPVDGPSVLARALALVHAVRQERIREYRFLPGHCVRVSEDELDLLAALRSARRCDADLLEGFAAMLAGQPETPRILMALRALVLVLDRLAILMAAEGNASAGRGEPSAMAPQPMLH